jgi:hypothetical protein
VNGVDFDARDEKLGLGLIEPGMLLSPQQKVLGFSRLQARWACQSCPAVDFTGFKFGERYGWKGALS